jgi:3-deoxy-manno-octulosonate cytidylyltransferase (CMP-KDO synthetase)
MKKEKYKDGILCVIPARYASTRLPGKPLLLFKGIPLVMWAYNAAKKANVFDIICVATDDKRIHETVMKYGGISYLTSFKHKSGTDRVFEVSKNFSYKYIVNIQGDEPIVSKSLLKNICKKIKLCDDNSLITCVYNAKINEINNPNVVKVVFNNKKEALYFSRSTIPYFRDKSLNEKIYYIHRGIYGFTAESLKRFCSFKEGKLESFERLEQLRALENGMKIICITTKEKGFGIDTKEDAEEFKKMIER